MKLRKFRRKLKKQRHRVWVSPRERAIRRNLRITLAIFVLRASLEVYDELVRRPRQNQERLRGR